MNSLRRLLISITIGTAASFVAFGGLSNAQQIPKELPDGVQVDAVKPPKLRAIIKKDKKDLKKRGYLERLDDIPRAEFVKSRMAQRRARRNGSKSLD